MLANYYQVRSRFSEAEQQLRGGIQADPKNPGTRSRACTLVSRARQEGRSRRFSKTGQAEFSRQLDWLSHCSVISIWPPMTWTKPRPNIGRLYHQHPKDLQVKKNYTELLILTNQLQQARELDEEILKAESQRQRSSDLSWANYKFGREMPTLPLGHCKLSLKMIPNNGRGSLSPRRCVPEDGKLAEGRRANGGSRSVCVPILPMRNATWPYWQCGEGT